MSIARLSLLFGLLLTSGAQAETPRETSSTTREPASNEARLEREARRATLREHNSLNGSVGLLRLVEADSGAAGTYRASFLGNYFGGSAFLCTGTPEGGCANVQATPMPDQVTRYSMRLALSGTLLPFLEAYFGASTIVTSNDQSRPELVQVVGNPSLGLKAFTPALPKRMLRFGAAADLWMPSNAGSTGIDADAVSFGLRALGTLDLTAREKAETALPIRAHVNVGYVFDNSGALVEEAEATRGAPISRVRRYALGINRLDRVELGIGVESTLNLVQPFLEWSIDVPVARQDYHCSSQSLEPGDSCLASATFASVPSRLGVGARFHPPVDGLGLLLAFEIGTGATQRFLQELVPETPYQLYLGVGYALDAVPAPPLVETVKVETVRVVETRAPSRFLVGKVLNRATGAPVAGAVVRLGTAQQSPLVTGEDGAFRSGGLEPGKVELVITAPEFLDGRCEAVLPPAPDASQQSSQQTAGGDLTVEVTCPLEPLAKLGGVLGSLYDSESGAVVGDAKVTVQDRAGRKLELVANPSGMFRLQNIPFGTMTLAVDATGYLFAVWRVDVSSREEVQKRIALHPRPKRSTITVTPKAIRVAKPVRFEPGTTRLLPGAEASLQELAEVLRARPDVALLEIRGYMDETGALSEAMRISRERAELIRGLLLDLGVEGERVAATGVLEDEPAPPGAKAGAGRQVTFAVLEFGRKR